LSEIIESAAPEKSIRPSRRRRKKPANAVKANTAQMEQKTVDRTVNAVQPSKLPSKKGNQTSRPNAKPTANHAARRASDTLKVIPLGGMREIGKNMTVYEYGHDMIIVDCGITFPDETMPGIDVVIPDFAYVRENISKLRGIFLTHGHEDHIGALPWLCKEVNVPIYGGHLTIALVRQKLEDRGTGVRGVNLVEINDGDRKKAGCFDVEFIHTNHSIADANALAIRTPAGTVFHSGDFKIDYTPINGSPIDLGRIAEIGSEGVLLLVCESTNVERSGQSSSESKVGETFIDLFGQAAGRIFVTTFSSNVFRIQQIFTAAEQYKRKVVLIGRSMLNYFTAADTLGYVKYKPNTLIDIKQVNKYNADELVFITTGSQGEPLSALTRMAFAEHKQIEIVPGDTVILSSSAIPGNEKPIYTVINELYKRGARVIYESLSEIHVSGHAYQEELKILHSLVQPKYFIPAHGEYRHLYRHAELANLLGLAYDHIFLLNNGDIFEYDEKKEIGHLNGFVHTSAVMIDGSGIGDIDQQVLRDRLLLADDGIVIVAVAINQQTGELVGQPNVQARGFIFASDSEKTVKSCQKAIIDLASKAGKEKQSLKKALHGDAITDKIQRLLFDKTKRRPIIMIAVIEV
jgi:ribonuclease J